MMMHPDSPAGLPGRRIAYVYWLSLIAVVLAVGVTYLVMRSRLGLGFTAIRDDLRRQRALLLLDNRALSIGEIATRLGYSELPNFTRAFRKWTGVTPVAYRERAR
jgi:AraC-like DNA-binding protein